MKRIISTLLYVTAVTSGFVTGGCSNEKQKVSQHYQLVGAWTMNSQEQQGQTVPVGKGKTIDQFGSSNLDTLQLDISNTTLDWIETNQVQVEVIKYTWSIDGAELVLHNMANASDVQRLPFTVNTTTLTVQRPGSKVLLTRTLSGQLATKTSAAATKKQNLTIELSIPTGADPLQVSTSGEIDGLASTGGKVVLQCTYDFKNKIAKVNYSNKKESPTAALTLNVPMIFQLIEKKETTLFGVESQITGVMFGKKVSATAAPCVGTLARDEFYVQLDLRCGGITIEGSTTAAAMSGTVNCLF